MNPRRRRKAETGIIAAVCLLTAAWGPMDSRGAGLESVGNTDGVLTWQLGDIEPGASVREAVLFAFDGSVEGASRRIQDARAQLKGTGSGPANSAKKTEALPYPTPGAEGAAGTVWISNGSTDFALERACLFRWRLKRQSLACRQGGQLSQFAWFVHYEDADGAHRAGTLNDGEPESENLRVVEPVRIADAESAQGIVETGEGRLRLGIRARVMTGSAASVEIAIENRHSAKVSNVRLSAYANIEAAHTHEGDLSTLDARTGGLLVVDPATHMAVIMAGLTTPVSGFSGTWNSMGKARAGEGIPLAEWKPFAGFSKSLENNLVGERQAAAGIYLPYVFEHPRTPETRTLTQAEGDEALRQDWMFQAAGHPLLERARAEIGWARALAARLKLAAHAPELGELAALEQRILNRAAGKDPVDPKALYLEVRTVKRRIAFQNPAFSFTQLLFIDQPLPQGRVNPEHEAIHRMGITAVPGGRLLLLDRLHPKGTIRRLAPDKPGSFWRPDLSFDARRVLFCFKPHDEKGFHLYEMNLDGSGLRQLTWGDYDDVDPIYLSDGRILFTTTRANSHVRCGPFIYSYTLARCDADGGNIYFISCNGEPDFVPALLPDGRVIYSRWEYSDKALWRIQSLWTTGQDGTGTRVFWGNQSVWPDHLCEPRPIPGSRRVMFSGVGHHDWWSGSIGIIDPDKGMNFPHGLTKVTRDLRWPECSLPPVDPGESETYHASGGYTGYKTPYPIGEQDFLVSARGEGGKFRLYWMDFDGNRDLIYEGAHNIWHAIPIQPRTAPPQQPSMVAWPGTGRDRQPSQPGIFYSSDVYDGVPDLPRGSVKYLRVFQLDYKTYSTWKKTYRHSGPAVSIIQEEGVKRILSEVPVESDGSVSFKVPPGRALFFQLLDEHYRCLHTMRSFAGLMPGEVRGCVGCHESHSAAPPRQGGLALRRSPTELTPPPWGQESIGYERFVQPVLDRHCGGCHQGDGKGRKTLDLTLRPGVDVFKEPYLSLVGSAGWHNPSASGGSPVKSIAGAIPVESMDLTMNQPEALATLRPMQYLSPKSKLIEIAMGDRHHDVRVDALDLRRLIAWVDACCPFMGEEEIRALDDPDFEGIAMLPIRPRVKSAPAIERP